MTIKSVPDFLDVRDDVTKNPRFSAHFLSLRDSMSPVNSTSPRRKKQKGQRSNDEQGGGLKDANGLNLPPADAKRSQSSHTLGSLTGEVH
mmetsp:Transcript_19138/g.36046  ORF Transcript_19138/g.36046 Transcript_19138/m.36046 type:complete len:90 (+) Transcript_19138:340-609(+)